MQVKIVLDGDGSFPELAGEDTKQGTLTAITALPGGMDSGAHSVALIGELEDGSKVFMETSMKLFQMAASAMYGRFGDVTGEVKATIGPDGTATVVPDEGH